MALRRFICHIARAFTLIELLVVVSIVAVLIALSLPAMGKAKFKAEQLNCLSRMRQMPLAVAMYANDNKGYFPYINSSVPSYDYGGWAGKVFQYCGPFGDVTEATFNYRNPKKRFAVMTCPSRAQGVWSYGYDNWLFAINWAMQFTPSKTWGQGGEVPQRVDSLTRPAKAGLFVDAGCYATAIHPPNTDQYGIFGHPAGYTIASPNHDGRGMSQARVDGSGSFTEIDQASYVAASVRPPWWYKSWWAVVGSWGYTNGFND
jgi:prepilin-type N-terminal cleavage/methylation domain-containing protein